MKKELKEMFTQMKIHTASLEDFSVLDRPNIDFDLLIHESIFILHDRSSLNSQRSSTPKLCFNHYSFGLAVYFSLHVGAVNMHF